MRFLGLDIGQRRIGVAVSDPDAKMALPLTILDRRGPGDIGKRLAEIVSEYEIAELVVGLPLRTDGREGPEARLVRSEADAIGCALDLPVR